MTFVVRGIRQVSVCGYLFVQRNSRNPPGCLGSLSCVSGTHGHSNRSLNRTHQWIFLNICKCEKSPEQPSVSLCVDRTLISQPCRRQWPARCWCWLQSSALGKWSLKTKSCFIIVECQNYCAVWDDNQKCYNGFSLCFQGSVITPSLFFLMQFVNGSIHYCWHATCPCSTNAAMLIVQIFWKWP